MRVDRHVRDVMLGRQADPDDPEDSSPRMFEGKVIGVDADGVRFTIPVWDGGKHEFGPVPYPVWTDAGRALLGPQKDNTCLVVFLGNNSDVDSQTPWVLGWR
jgi:hypothetical protein